MPKLDLDWIALAGRTLWYAGLYKGQSRVTFGPTTIERVLGLDAGEFAEGPLNVAHLIAAAVPKGSARWQNGRLVIEYEAPAKARIDERDVQRIVSLWRDLLHERGSLGGRIGKDRRRLIEARLAEGNSVDHILDAIRGCAASDRHRSNGWTDLTLICRSSAQLDKMARWHTHGLPEMLRGESTSALDRLRRGVR